MMKKAIRPPENWQDFETLCKKLYGEIWKCPHTIKKNGRLGQPQSGIDIYGKPKGESEYWGIQCKGKDNYLENKLTEKEIDEEISKALLFEPKLKTLIFTTTAPKDVNIEKYIRLKDIESSSNNSFEIVLYSWQDIADLIEENRDTFNWYVNEFQFKEQFDIEIEFHTKKDNNILSPKFLKTITEFKLETETDFDRYNFVMPSVMTMQPIPFLGNNKVNRSWCKIHTNIKNTGSIVLEDWKLYLTFENVLKVDDDFTKDVFMYKTAEPYRTTWAYEKEKKIGCFPIDNSPLIQKDSRSFNGYCIPNVEATEIKIKWHLLARNFDREGEIVLAVYPDYKTKNKTEYVNSEELQKTVTVISEYLETISDKKKGSR
jgi:hypothetical protein